MNHFPAGAGVRYMSIPMAVSTTPPYGGDPAELPTGRVTRSDASHSVNTITELRDALARSGTDGDTIIDATELPARASVPEGTTLDGNGATVLVARRNPAALVLDNPGSTVRNLRLIGYHRGFLGADGETYSKDAVGIWVRAQRCHVENVHALGWPHAGIAVGVLTQPEGSGPAVTIRGCSLSENMLTSLGYGVVVYRGHALIEGCAFDGQRHHIAGSGQPDCSYEVRGCHFGRSQLLFGVEMHAPGGKSIHVHHNTFERARLPSTGADRHNVVMRGVSATPSRVHHNWFKSPHVPHATRSTVTTPPAAIYQYNHGRDTWLNLTNSENAYGPTEPPAHIGRPRPAEAGGGPDDGRPSPADIPLWVDDERRRSVARGLDAMAEALAVLAAVMRDGADER